MSEIQCSVIARAEEGFMIWPWHVPVSVTSRSGQLTRRDPGESIGPTKAPDKQKGFSELAETLRSLQMLRISLKSKKLWCSAGTRGSVVSFCQDGSSHPSPERPGATCASSKVNCHEWELGIYFQGQNFQSLNKQNMKVIQTESTHHFQHISKEQCSLPESEENFTKTTGRS